MTFTSAKRAFKAIWLVAAVAVFVLGPGAKVGDTNAALGDNNRTRFNTAANDFPVLRVSNYTTDCPTCWSSSITAKPGDVVSFDVYYNNNGDVDAENTTIHLSPSSGNVISMSAILDASNAPSVSGNVTVNVVGGPAHLEFDSGVWYKDQSMAQSPLPGGPYDFSLGNVGSDCPLRGDLIVRFRVVADQPAQPTTCTASLSWDKQSVQQGGSATETWSVQGAEAVYGTCTGQAEHQISTGPQSFTFNNLQSSMTCSVRGVINGQTACQASATVSVNGAVEPNVHGFHDGYTGQQPPASCIASGWAADPDSSNPVTVQVYIDGRTATTAQANLPRPDLANAGVCTGSAKAAGTCAFSVNLDQAFQNIMSRSIINSGPHNITVRAHDTETGEPVLLNWTDKSIECVSGVVTPQCTAPTATLNQVSVFQGQTSATISANITVNQGSAPVSYTFYAGKSLGSLSPVPGGSGTVSASQSVSATLTGLAAGETYYYQIVINGQCGGSQTFGPLSFTVPTSPTSLCTDPRATNYGGPLPCIFPPAQCTTQAEQPVAYTGAVQNITQNSATIFGSASNATSAWFEWRQVGTSNVNRVNSTVSPGGTSADLAGLSPSTTYEFRMRAQNVCGTKDGDWRQFTTPNAPPQCVAPSLQVLSASSVTLNSAVLNGSISGGSTTNYPLTYYFKVMDQNGNVVQQTNQQTIASGQNVSATVNGLSPNTAYTYQLFVVGACSGALSSGTIQFNTLPPQCVAPVPTVQTASSITTNSATLNGTLSAGSNQNLTYYFQVKDQQGNVVQQTNPQTVAYAGASIAVQALVSNLSPNTAYTYQIFVTGQCGGTVNSGPMSFITTGTQCTAPVPTVQTASSITNNSATLNGTLTGGTSQTVSYYFQVKDQQGNVVQQTNQQTASYNGSSLPVQATVSNLSPNTNYTYQLFLTGQCGGTVSSGTMNFSTTGSPQCTAPTATLNQVANVSQGQNVVTVSAYVSVPSGSAPVGYAFVYGTSQNNLSQTTGIQYITNSQTVYGTLTGLNLQPGQTYWYGLAIQGQCGGEVDYGPLSFSVQQQPPQCTPPTVSIGNATNITQNSATLNGYVDPHGYSTSYWFQYNNGQTTGTQYVGTAAQNVTTYVSNLTPNTYYTVTLYATNQCGTNSSSYTSFTTPGSYQPPYQPAIGQPPTVITDAATALARNSALLNGRVNPNNSATMAWFTYATNPAQLATCTSGIPTNQQSMGNSSGLYNYSVPLTGLNAGTTYYYRAVGQNAYGTNCGQIQSFTTAGGGILYEEQPPVVERRPPVVVTTVAGGVVGGGSCLILIPTLQPANPAAGQEFIYGVTYRNDCPFDLLNSSMRIYLPNEVDFSSTNYPFLTRDLNVITYNLGTIPRNFQNTVLVRGVTKITVVPGDNLIFKADLSFTDAQRRLQTVSAFLNATVAGAMAVAGGAVTGAVTATGAASILDTLLSFLSSPWFWFLLFLLLLALFILWLATRNRHDEEELEHA